MNIIITSGGTVEPIDAVRSITNKSSGKLGSLIALNCLEQFPDSYLFYIHGKNTPPLHTFTTNIRNIEINTTDDLAQVVTELLTTKSIDLFVHAMAVADYTTESVIDADYLKTMIMKNHQFLTEYTLNECFKLSAIDRDSKVSSQSNVLINLKQTPKIIKTIKELSPYTFLVGFKLLDNTTEENLFDVGFDLLRKNRCNLVLANDLSTIKDGNHTGMLIYPEKTSGTFVGKENIAKNLVRVIKKRIDAAHPRSQHIGPWEPSEKIVDDFHEGGRHLGKLNLLPRVTNHNKTDQIGTYGNLSLRTGIESFVITGRNINKANIEANDLVKVDHISFDENKNQLCNTYATVNYMHNDETAKPSIDAAIHGKLYELFDMNTIIHVHTPDKLFLGVPIVAGQHPCGSKPELDAIIDVMNDNKTTEAIQLEKHGLMIFDGSFKGCRFSLADLLKDRPDIDLSEKVADRECLEHIKDSGADFVKLEESHPIKIKNQTIGMIWESIKENDANTIEFGIYTKAEFQQKGLGIIKKYLHMRQNHTMILRTKPDCNVANVYKEKYGFVDFYQDDNSIVLLKKRN